MWDVIAVQEKKTLSTAETSNSNLGTQQAKQLAAIKLLANDARAANTSATHATIPANANNFHFIIEFLHCKQCSSFAKTKKWQWQHWIEGFRKEADS